MKPPLALVVLLSFCGALFAADSQPAADPVVQAAEFQFAAGQLKPQSGHIVLHGGLAMADLPANLRYLSPADTRTVLTKIWGNPDGPDTLGMIVPKDFDPNSAASWAVVMTYEEDGYVKDDDAATIDYTKLLAQMKEGVAEANKEREKQGYHTVDLVGWARPPHYDATAKKLYWAKELNFGGESAHTLNYNIRMLGRRGVLVLNAVAGMNQLATVEAATPAILGAVNFQEGHRYADFNGDTDKVATYGIAALVAGGLAAKAGFFKLLWVGLLAFKKVIIIALIALASQFKKLLAWIRSRQTKSAFVAPTGSDAPPPPAAG
jgi:uncharacterized membrane-anchored protein